MAGPESADYVDACGRLSFRGIGILIEQVVRHRSGGIGLPTNFSEDAEKSDKPVHGVPSAVGYGSATVVNSVETRSAFIESPPKARFRRFIPVISNLNVYATPPRTVIHSCREDAAQRRPEV